MALLILASFISIELLGPLRSHLNEARERVPIAERNSFSVDFGSPILTTAILTGLLLGLANLSKWVVPVAIWLAFLCFVVTIGRLIWIGIQVRKIDLSEGEVT